MPGHARTRRPPRTEAGATASLLLAAGLLLLVVACGPDHQAAGQGSTGSAEVAAEPIPAVARASSLETTAGSTDSAASWTMPPVPAAIAQGILVYRANYCGTCHRNTLAGTAGMFGPSHDSLRINALRRIHDPRYTGHATTAGDYVRESIRDPGAWRVPGFERTRFLMPAYIQLTDSEVDALVRMLLWQPPAKGER